jgi:Rha family phage regulatory protein
MSEITLAVLNGHATTTSLQVAEHFRKAHYRVLRAIDNLECSPEFRSANFGEALNVIEQTNGGTTEYRSYTLTRDGFVFLCMGFTGKEAAQWKEKYIAAFNAMEAKLKHPVSPAPELAPPKHPREKRYDYPRKLLEQPYMKSPATSALWAVGGVFSVLRPERRGVSTATAYRSLPER